jgi:hypothetical protein
VYDARVQVRPAPVAKNQQAEVVYQGLLTKAGADRVYLHYGFDGWQDVATKPMFKQNDGSFFASVPAVGDHEVNLCFKDSAANWDNNNGWNWSIPIELRY